MLVIVRELLAFKEFEDSKHAHFRITPNHFSNYAINRFNNLTQQVLPRAINIIQSPTFLYSFLTCPFP